MACSVYVLSNPSAAWLFVPRLEYVLRIQPSVRMKLFYTEKPFCGLNSLLQLTHGLKPEKEDLQQQSSHFVSIIFAYMYMYTVELVLCVMKRQQERRKERRTKPEFSHTLR